MLWMLERNAGPTQELTGLTPDQIGTRFKIGYTWVNRGSIGYTYTVQKRILYAVQSKTGQHWHVHREQRGHRAGPKRVQKRIQKVTRQDTGYRKRIQIGDTTGYRTQK
jgi:hypothetical protein